MTNRNLFGYQTGLFVDADTQIFVVTDDGDYVDVDNLPTVIWGYNQYTLVGSDAWTNISVMQGHPAT